MPALPAEPPAPADSYFAGKAFQKRRAPGPSLQAAAVGSSGQTQRSVLPHEKESAGSGRLSITPQVGTSIPLLRVTDALGPLGTKLSIPEDYLGERSVTLLRQKSPQRRSQTRAILLHQPLAPSLQGTSPAQRGDGGCGDWMSHREWSFLGLIKTVSSLPVCCMFFVALSFEQGPKRWDPDCRHFPSASFCSGVAVLGLMGCSEVTLCSPHLGDHGLLAGCAI